MSAIKLSYRYAKSLLDLAVEKQQEQPVFEDISSLAAAVKSNRDLKLLLQSPIVNGEKKESIITKIMGNTLNPITHSFVQIILRKRRENYLPEILHSFVEQYNQHNKITTAQLTTAVEATPAILQQVVEIVKKQTGKQTVTIETKIDPSIIGGFVLQFEDKQIDTSIADKLDDLQLNTFSENKYIKKY